MILGISSTEISTGVVAIFGVAQAINIWLSRKNGKEISQVNTAVNHIDPGQPTLRQSVEIIKNELEMVKAVALVNKTQAEERFSVADEKHDRLRGMVEEVKDAQAEITVELKKIRESVDRRKGEI
jgi:hypothetical protein